MRKAGIPEIPMKGCIPLQKKIYVALVHYPVLNRNSEVIASALTNFDLHDLARLVCTYDLPCCYIVTPLQDQQCLAQKLIAHWVERIGKDLHPQRSQALKRLKLVHEVKDAVADIEGETGAPPQLWATTARSMDGTIGWGRARDMVKEDEHSILLLLGTGWGLAKELMDEVHGILEPIAGANGYNHLSVRCAAAIMLDRLAGMER